jgi:aminocarboxymuconate-semialdehyde decarboxylase
MEQHSCSAPERRAHDFNPVELVRAPMSNVRLHMRQAVIDTHTHITPMAYRHAAEGHLISSSDEATAAFASLLLRAHPGLDEEVDRRLASMVAAGVDRSVLSLPPPGLYLADAGAASALCSDANDEMIGIAAQHSDRFCVLATMPLPHVDLAIAELERLRAEPLVRGVSVMTPNAPWTLDAPEYVPFFEAAALYEIPVALHGSVEGLPTCLLDWNLIAGLGMLNSSTIAVLRLVYSGLFDKVPDLQAIVTHLGGTMPFVLDRIDTFAMLSGTGTGRAQHKVAHYCRERLYFDSCLFDPAAIRCAAEVMGAERIILGSDGFAEDALAALQKSGFAAGDLERILGGTASKWFGA